MVNELCELASSGVSVVQTAAFVVAIISAGVVLFVLHKKNKVNVKWILPTLLFVFSLSLTTTRQTVFAQSADDCMPKTQGSNTSTAPSSPGQSAAIGGLVNDNPVIDFSYSDAGPGNFMTFDGASGSFKVLTNDSSPDGDPFNISTLRLIGDHPDPDYPGDFLILDPSDLTNSTVWGYWTLELTCDVNDAANCFNQASAEAEPLPYCIASNGDGCWPSGYVYVEFYDNTPPGRYSINYSISTDSGTALTPATVTITIPAPIQASPITSHDVADSTGCQLFSDDYSIDLMNGDFFSTVGPGLLSANTIDLDPETAGRQTEVIKYSISYPENYFTYTVSESGILTIKSTWSVNENLSPNYINFTIYDSNGFTSDVPASFYRNAVCG